MENPGFYAILPASVRYDNRLKPAEKIFTPRSQPLPIRPGTAMPATVISASCTAWMSEPSAAWVQHLQQYGYADVSYAREGNDNQRPHLAADWQCARCF